MIARLDQDLGQHSHNLRLNRSRAARLDGGDIFARLWHGLKGHRYRLDRHSLHSRTRRRDRLFVAAGGCEPEKN
jgi:hypothetical protein